MTDGLSLVGYSTTIISSALAIPMNQNGEKLVTTTPSVLGEILVRLHREDGAILKRSCASAVINASQYS